MHKVWEIEVKIIGLTLGHRLLRMCNIRRKEKNMLELAEERNVSGMILDIYLLIAYQISHKK